MTGKKVKLVWHGNECKSNSNNPYIGSDHEFVVGESYPGLRHGWFIANDCGTSYGWAYEWEMEEVGSSKVVLKESMERLKSEMEELQRKIDFLNETGNEQFDAEEYKVYSTLKLFQNDKLTDVEKSKLIAKLIKGK